ncbi:MAG: 50S ribosomal protein L24 [Clostridia bacterium]|nr:50S ribosomal protein L24 [Clostridia bacterium]
MRVKKGDTVMVITGKDTGKKGKVLRALPRQQRVVVEGINIVKRHQRPTQALPQGGIIEKEAALHASNVMVICSKCDRPVRTGRKVTDGGEKVRYCKKCGNELD